ncbi:MAG: discoidin domain-containing protein [Phocaeicola sp.]|nr:discoidin domain-containing protein [Phocaeicola sp.]
MKFRYIIVACAAAMLATSCDDKLEAFEMQGYTGTPASIENITSEALPGQIQLRWDAPEGDFAYMKIWYNDPLQKKTIYNIASKGTTELLIDETRARFGEYEFFFQSFNANDEGGEIISYKAVSGPAPATYTLLGRTQITLTADMLSTNAQEPSEGPIKNLVDGNNSTFFHTPWSYTQEFPQWIQIDFNEPHENFIIGYVNRTDNTWTSDGRPAVVDLQISNDKTEWETVTTLSGLPSSAGSEYTSDFVMPGKTFTSFRFSVTSATGSASYWNMGEFMMYDADVEIYDPETVELD